ncbi:hypothetical protein [Oryzihumus leptocrescens]|uniref:hypothetical protein n=1 Tax=Oryzihumus leptocrescens TaxID=297536 RepID=UPI00114E403C|nr:hypothetical protein [Oryzihumus leptocrescens]
MASSTTDDVREVVLLRPSLRSVFRPLATGGVLCVAAIIVGLVVSLVRGDFGGDGLGMGIGLLAGAAMLVMGLLRCMAWSVTIAPRTVVDTGTHLVGRWGRSTRHAVPWDDIERVTWIYGSRLPELQRPAQFFEVQADTKSGAGRAIITSDLISTVLLLDVHADSQLPRLIEACRKHGVDCQQP